MNGSYFRQRWIYLLLDSAAVVACTDRKVCACMDHAAVQQTLRVNLLVSATERKLVLMRMVRRGLL